MRFEVGHQKLGGRRKSTLNKTSIEVRELAREFVADPAYRRSLRQRVIQGRAQHIETLLWHYAFGKPKEQVEPSGGPVKFTLNLGDHGNGRGNTR